MPVEFKARVLLELGAELISSDAVALYELIKNAIDAKSPSVEVFFSIVLQHSAYLDLLSELDRTASDPFSAEAFSEVVISRLESDALKEDRDAFTNAYGNPKSQNECMISLKNAYFVSNFIRISDFGSGMTKEILQSGYLTVGTPMRLLEKVRSDTPDWQDGGNTRPALGEKGIGRLAAMRLGHYVLVETLPDTATGDKQSRCSELELDWRKIFDDPTLDASALDYEPVQGKLKPVSQHGTTLTIRFLQSDWTEQKIKMLAATDLAKLSDPFESDFIADFLRVQLQGQDVVLPEFDSAKMKHADAECVAAFRRVDSWNAEDPLDGLELFIEINYKHYKTSRAWHLRSEHLASCITDIAGRRKAKLSDPLADNDSVIAALPRLGPFDMKFFWFNRGRMQREENAQWTQLEPFVRNWSGGLLVYRNNFRVYPYGAPYDDWLDLDRSALSGSAFKLNRAQIIGRLQISQRGNPALLDQTNREGFRDCPEKEVLKRLLRHVFITKCKIFFEETVKEDKKQNPETITKLEKRVDASEFAAVTSLQKLRKRVPQETEPINEILYQIGEIRDAWERTKATIKDQEGELEQYIHLAGVGLQVEFIAHELSRVTFDALNSLKSSDALRSESARAGLEAQLKTLEKRIRVLDLLSVPGRQRKQVLDIHELVKLLGDMHSDKIQRHKLEFRIESPSNKPFKAKVEKGQILQILDNLFSNSFYWLAHRFDRKTSPVITVAVDSSNGTIKFSDNGPGVPSDMAADIFKAFVTTKPPGAGRGLGLFISRRLAEYNDGSLELGPISPDGVYHSFVLNLSKAEV